MLTDWIVAAAESQNFPVQSTSIPGVAQRTGATTYHIELVPTPASKSEKRRPILALAPGVGDVDLVVASELMEAGRAIAGGFVTPDRTTTIASTSRSYLVVEKMAMGDGRYDQQRLLQSVEKNSKSTLLLDLEAIAREAGAMINAVMLGAIAGAGALPIPAEAFEAAIRADGKAVEANLRGFRAGFAAARGGSHLRSDPTKRHQAPAASLADLENEIARMPEAARAFMTEGVRRLAAYQDLAYARLYLDRLGPIRDADAKAGADGQLLAETARHLAVRMSYEDVIRVAQAKIDPARFARIAATDGHQAGSAVRRHRIPQARRRGILLDPAAMAGAADPRVRRASCENSPPPIGAWRSTPRRCPASCASTSSPSCAASGRARGATGKNSATSAIGSSSSCARPHRPPSLRSRSRSAPASSKATATPTSAAAIIIARSSRR